MNPGEVVISWDVVPQATHYRIGYVNMETDYPLAKASATGDWINAFIYVDEEARNLRVYNGRAEYTVRRLAQGVRHAFTVLSSDLVINDTLDLIGFYSWPQNPRWQFLVVADQGGSCPTAPPTGGTQPGEGDICPITGLPIPAGGYLGVGDTQRWSNASFKLDSATIVPSITNFGLTYRPAHGNRYLELCSTWYNATGNDFFTFSAGKDNNLSTDAGIGFSVYSDGEWLDVSPIPNGATESACDVWLVSASATTAVYAIFDGKIEDAVLYQIPLPTN